MINYPNKKSISIDENKETHSNRGMNFERLINISNEYYITNDIGIIHKKPTPIKVVKVNYQKNQFYSNRHCITEAYYEMASTTDYNGIYKGHHIDFEAKQTKYMTFNVGSNLKQHQLEHLNNVCKHGGIGFILVCFIKVNEIFLVTYDKIVSYCNEKTKSIIPYEFFKKEAYVINSSYLIPVDYMPIVDLIINKEKNVKKEN